MPETLQPVDEPSVDARGDPGPREKLPPMRVPGKLQGDALLFRDLQLIGSVREQNAGALGVERCFPQNGAESVGMNESTMVHTDEVHAIKGYLFVVQYANTGSADRVEVFRVVREFFVIPCNEKRAQRWRQVNPRLGHPLRGWRTFRQRDHP